MLINLTLTIIIIIITTIIIIIISMTVKGGSRPACAACRFQRRRCSPDCPLAPYFPANQPKIFQNVHRLYGVGNVMKILKHLKDNDQKQEAMKSIKYESYIRQIYRVEGCYGTIISLQQQLVDSMRELQYVRVLLDAYKKNEGYKPTHESFVFDVNGEDLGGSNDWRSEMMINEGDHDHDHDLGIYYDDHRNANEVVRRVMELSQPLDWNDLTKTGVDSIKYRSYLDSFQSSSVEQGEETPNYEEMTCDLFVDDPKDAYEIMSSDTTYFTEPEESKANKGLFEVQHGVHHLTMEYQDYT